MKSKKLFSDVRDDSDFRNISYVKTKDDFDKYNEERSNDEVE